MDEGPAVGAEHEDAVGGIDEAHAGGEENGEDEDGPDRQALRRLRGGNSEQADLGGGVEAQAEEESERIHLPAAVDGADEGAYEAADPTHLLEGGVEGFFRVAAAATAPKVLATLRQHEEVDGGDGEEENGGTSAPIRPPRWTIPGKRAWMPAAVTAMPIERPMTIVEWPREKKKPTRAGRWPSCMSLRVTLSMAEM